jgi:hypothetical protein
MATRKRPDSFVSIGGEDCGPDAGEEAICVCRDAVRRCYAGMTRSGAPDKVAMEAAVRVYRHHHPEAPTHLSRETVEVWVYAGSRH